MSNSIRGTNKSAQVGDAEIQKVLQAITNKIESGQPINLVSYIYDDNCAKHQQMDIVGSDGRRTHHQESRDRVLKINGALHHTGLGRIVLSAGTVSVERSDILAIHDKDYVKDVEHFCRMNKEHSFGDHGHDLTIKNFDSLAAIYAAIASVMGGVQLACSGVAVGTNDIGRAFMKEKKTPPHFRHGYPRRVFCNIRPPGHHAQTKHGAGFCFMNNVAIGARYAMTRYPDIRKVLIIDWDLHHGDGTQEIFAQSENANQNVMYVSLHRGPDFYPFTGTLEDNSTYRNVLNSPFPANVSIDEYMNRFNNVVIPAALEFDPDLIFISAGFDSHKDDLYHALPLDYEHYGYMTRKIVDLAETCSNGRLISVLEGGYTIPVLIRSVMVHIGNMIEHDGEQIILE